MMRLIGVVACALAAGGCSDRLLRETVFANTGTMVGVSIGQSATTGAYELNAGFARHELFLVPTDKTIAYDQSAGTQSHASAGAEKTANVIGEIQVGGTGRGPGGRVETYQRLAVGDLAVRSGAAVALMASDPATAAAVTGTRAAFVKRLGELDRELAGSSVEIEGEAAAWGAAREAIAKSLGFGSYATLVNKGNEVALSDFIDVAESASGAGE